MNVVSGRIRRMGLVWIVVALWGWSPDTQKPGATPSPAAPEAFADIQIADPKPYPFRFVAYGDMRSAENASYAGRTIANATARQQVIDQIGAEAPAFVVSTGDFVFRGFHTEDWTYFDKVIQPLRDRGIPIYPAIGNHEVGPFPNLWGPKVFKEIENDTHQHIAARGLKNYYKQFPAISQKRWYSVQYANCYFLILDSELMDDASNAAQDQWLKTQLDSIPAGIDYVFVTLLRAPYTAFTDPVHRPGPRQLALARMLEARQPGNHAHIIVISGHVHNYERYQHNGVDYVVSGGGGAAQDKFKRAADDLYPHNTLYGKNDRADEDQYHYCVFTVDHAKLSFRMMKLVAKGSSVTFEPRDGFQIPPN